jgi:hypothetical protein
MICRNWNPWTWRCLTGGDPQLRTRSCLSVSVTASMLRSRWKFAAKWVINFRKLAAFFRQYELAVLASTEEDSLRVRTNVRGEDGYLYRVQMPEGAARALFLSYVQTASRLVRKPRFYNTLTANCTTIVYRMVDQIVPGLPLDYRLLLSGYLPEYLYQLDALDGADTPEAYRLAGHYTERARATQSNEQYSRNIRCGVPGVKTT